jgi:tRNA 2-selenouridine synthase
VEQPTQKLFDSHLLQQMRGFSPDRPIWVEAESKKIGNVQLPDALHEAMHATTPIEVVAPMDERVRLWREDYAHLAADPSGMVRKLAPLKPLIGGQELALWEELAEQGRVDELFERVMVAHYDPCYERSTRRSYKTAGQGQRVELTSLQPESLREAARALASS